MEEVAAREEDQVEAQAEAQAETMVEDHPAEDHPAEDHPVEGHKENLLETPQKETNWGEMTLGMTMSLATRIRTAIWRMMRTEAIPLHQGEVQPPQAITRTSSIPQHGGPKTPGEGMLEERNNAFRECLHEAIQDAARDVLRRTPVTAGTYALTE